MDISKEDFESLKSKYTVCANLYDGDGCIKHWDGETFTDIEAAYKFYNTWEPNRKEVIQVIRDNLKNSYSDERYIDNLPKYDLQIGCWDEKGYVVECRGVEMFRSSHFCTCPIL